MGSVILNVDATLVAEAPKIAPYLNAMKDQPRRRSGGAERPRRDQGDDE